MGTTVGVTNSRLTAYARWVNTPRAKKMPRSPVMLCLRRIRVLAPPAGLHPPLRWARPLLVPRNRGTPCYKGKALGQHRSLWLRGEQFSTMPHQPPWGRHVAKGRDVVQIHAVGLDLLRGRHRTPRVTGGPPRWVSDPSERGLDYSLPGLGILGQGIPGPYPGRGPGTTCVQT
jgi:hypothetical protein